MRAFASRKWPAKRAYRLTTFTAPSARSSGRLRTTFLLRQRLKRAASLLRRRDLSVTEVCLETGFESLPSFSTLFRRRFGVAPRDFRRAGSLCIPKGSVCIPMSDAAKIRKIE